MPVTRILIELISFPEGQCEKCMNALTESFNDVVMLSDTVAIGNEIPDETTSDSTEPHVTSAERAEAVSITLMEMEVRFSRLEKL